MDIPSSTLHCWKGVGAYRISNRILGEGASSTVHLAQGKQGLLAAKTIKLSNPQAMKCSQNEILSLQMCKSNHIIRLHDVIKSQSNLYLLLEYCDGGNLAQYILQRNKIPQHQAMLFMEQIIEALNVLREHKIIHRDIKPSNIMLSGATLKIVDFGLAHRAQELLSFAGTLHHMAPQIIEGKPYNSKVDVYSAGVVLYEMLCGRRPFQAKTSEALLIQIKTKSTAIQNISPQVQQLVDGMLQAQPKKRIDILSALRTVRHIIANTRRENLMKCINKHYCSVYMPLGSMLASFNAPLPQKPCSMDLRLYKKLCHRIQDKISVLG